MESHGFSSGKHWSTILPGLNNNQRALFNKQFNRCREDCLDGCQGRCLLRRPELARIVADSLLYFDGERYRMGDFVVIENQSDYYC